MKIKLSRTDTYAPKWNGNRSLLADDQIAVEYRYMTCEEEERFSVVRPVYGKASGGEVSDIAIDIHTHANEIWDACVLKVAKLRGDDGAEITEPKKVRAIPGVYGLVTEVVAEIKRGLTEQDSKNSA